MSPSRSSIAVVLMLAAGATFPFPAMLMRKHWSPNWAILGFLAYFAAYAVVLSCFFVGLRRFRSKQFAQWRDGIRERQRALLQACGISGIGGVLFSCESNFLRLVGFSIEAVGICWAAWLILRSWPDKGELNDRNDRPVAPPVA